MKRTFTAIALLISGFCFSQTKQEGLPAYTPESKPLHDTIASLDSIFFSAYNNCRINVMDSLIDEQVEFYHDRGGLSGKKAVVEGIGKFICNKVSRQLFPGSIEVYSIPNYGAVQMGAHRFINHAEGNSVSRYSKFVHTWRRQNGQWKLTRIISLH